MQHKVYFATAILLGFSILISVGCGNPDSRYIKVEGTVTYNGTVLEKAIVTFRPVESNGEAGTGATDAGGKYTLTSPNADGGGTGVLPGEYVVLIQKEEVTNVFGTDPDGADETVIRKHLLPEKYRKDSPLKVTVSKSSRKHDFDLTD